MKLTMTDSVREISILLVTARDNSAISAADIADHMPMGLGHIASYIKKNLIFSFINDLLKRNIKKTLKVKKLIIQ